MANLAQRLSLTQMQQQWASQINPLLSNQLTQGQLLIDITLKDGQTVINHRLGRSLVGWLVVGQNAMASLWDSQASNQTPQLTLVLNSNAACTVNLWVF
jgi:hypothetical protein